MTVTEAGVRELKANLSAYLRRVEAGETIIIVRHGKQIARLMPQVQSLDERIQALKEAGLLDWNGEKLEDIDPVGHIIGTKTIAELVVEDRR